MITHIVLVWTLDTLEYHENHLYYDFKLCLGNMLDIYECKK